MNFKFGSYYIISSIQSQNQVSRGQSLFEGQNWNIKFNLKIVSTFI